MRVCELQPGPGGYLILGAWVFAEQIGLPIPAAPALVAAGALTGAGRFQVGLAMAIAVAASVLADFLWYRAGILGSGAINRFRQRHPHSKTLDRAEQLAARYGSRTLLFGKFVPGLSLVAPPLCGISGTRVPRFLLFDGAGASIWAACWMGIGYFIGIGGRPISLSPMVCVELCAGIAMIWAIGHLSTKLRKRSSSPPADTSLTSAYREIPDRLTWLASLIGGPQSGGPDPRCEPLCPLEADNPFFNRWSTVWFRKLVIARALGSVAAELKDSARRTAPLKCPRTRPRPLPSAAPWELERALRAVDLFPRCVILLTMIEELSLDDTAVLLDADKQRIDTVRAIGMAELYKNLTHQQGQAPERRPALAAMSQGALS